jgi:hypothetical protein
MNTRIALLLCAAAAFLKSCADAPSKPSKDAIKNAAAYILSCDCGHCVEDPGYAENAKLLKDAGEALVPVLVELVADKTLSTWFVNNAAYRAGSFPFSQPFCDALRLRREDEQFDHDSGAMLGVFDYFGRFGDRTDLEWMERAMSRLDDRGIYAQHHVQKLRERLARK